MKKIPILQYCTRLIISPFIKQLLCCRLSTPPTPPKNIYILFTDEKSLFRLSPLSREISFYFFFRGFEIQIKAIFVLFQLNPAQPDERTNNLLYPCRNLWLKSAYKHGLTALLLCARKKRQNLKLQGILSYITLAMKYVSQQITNAAVTTNNM